MVRELTSLRTATSDTFLQSDGSHLLKISAHPINYRVGDAWQPIEDRLAEATNGSWHPAASPTPVEFPASLESGPVAIGPSGRQLSFSLEGASAAGAPAGAQRTYAGALPGVNVTYAASPGSVRETLTLASASAPTNYRYALSLSSGLKASLLASGGVAVRDGSGKLAYSLATPTVSDASSKPHLPWTSPVHYELSADGSVLSLVLDKKWLSDPARQFPVKIDPDVYFGGEQDCAIVSEAYANTSLCNGRLYVGADSASPKDVARSLEQFDLSSVPRGSAILSSNLALWFESTTTSSPIEIEAYALTRAFTQEATWNSFDGTGSWTAPGGDHLKTSAGASVIDSEYTGWWVKWGFTPQVEQWVRDPSSNHGILLKARDETTSGYDTFVEDGNGESAPEPEMNIVYEPRLGDAAGESMYQQSIGNGGTLEVNAANGNLHITDPDVRYEAEGYNTTVARSYNNRDDELSGSSLGDDWRLNMGEDELLYPAWWDGSNVFHQPDGSYTRFDRAPWADGHPSAGDKAFTGEANMPATLTVHENDTRSVTYNNTGIEWQFDNSENGFPQKIVDPGGEGNTISLSYTSSLLTKITDTHEHALTLTRSPSTTHITKIKASGGETWEYGYDSSHRLISYKGPGGQEAKYGYTTGEEVLQYISDPTGTIVISYGEGDRVASLRKLVNGTISTPGTEDEVTKFSYAAESTLVTHPDGSENTYDYDEFGNALEEPATQEAASTAYASYAGIEAEAANKDVDLQDHASILDSQLSQQLGANYTGEWFDAAAGGVKIGITSLGYEQTVEQDLDNLGLADNAEIVTATHSLTELEEGESSDDTALEELANEGFVRVGLESSTNSVTVETVDDLTSAQSAHVAEVAAHAAVPIVVTTRPVARFDGYAASCSGARCTAPLRGGVSIQEHGTPEKGEERVGYCTAGFIAKSDYGPSAYVLTAGHCIGEGAGVGEGWETAFPGDGTGVFGDRFIGHATAFIYGNSHSSSLPVKSKGDAGLIEIAATSEVRGSGLQPWVLDYGGAEPRNERYVIKGTHYNPHNDGPLEKFTVCTGGAPTSKSDAEFLEEGPHFPKTDERCGVTEGFRDQTDEPGGPHEQRVHNLEQFKACGGGHGDSGSPVYKNGRAYGIISSEEDLSSSECLNFYEGINTAESILGVHILTG